MAFQLNSPNKMVIVDEEEEQIFQLPEKFGLNLEMLGYLGERFYASPTLRDERSVLKLRDELSLLREKYLEHRREQIAAEKKVRAKNESARKQILDSMISDDPIKVIIERMMELCDDSLETSGPVICSSD